MVFWVVKWSWNAFDSMYDVILHLVYQWSEVVSYNDTQLIIVNELFVDAFYV